MVYSRANANNNNELYKLLENNNGNDIFIGDFNFPNINWNNLTSDRPSEAFLQSTIDNGLDQLIDFPTHIRGNILDIILTNRPENIISVEPLGNLANSDHSILSLDIMFSSKFNSTSELISDWKNGDADGLRSYLGDINWAEELGNKDAEQTWLHMLSKVNDGVSQYIPKIRRRQNNNHQWTTKIVKRLVRQKQRRYNTYMQTRSPSDYDRYKATEKECKKAVRRAKKKFEAKIATNGNKRPFNSYIKSKTKSRVNVGPLKQGTDLITDNFEMAKILNNQFSSVFSNEDLVNIPDCPDNSKGNMIHDTVFNPDNVLKKIKSLKVSSSSGPDGLSSKISSRSC